MHIRGNPISLNPSSFYSRDSTEKAASDRAASVRKRLLKSAAMLDSTDCDDEALLVDHWLEASPRRPGDDAEHRSDSSGVDSDFD
jgi:hypothetical protein